MLSGDIEDMSMLSSRSVDRRSASSHPLNKIEGATVLLELMGTESCGILSSYIRLMRSAGYRAAALRTSELSSNRRLFWCSQKVSPRHRVDLLIWGLCFGKRSHAQVCWWDVRDSIVVLAVCMTVGVQVGVQTANHSTESLAPVCSSFVGTPEHLLLLLIANTKCMYALLYIHENSICDVRHFD